MATEKYYKESRIKARLDSYLTQAKEEYTNYQSSKDTTKLAEAGEKLWGAFNYLMEIKAHQSLKTNQEVIDAVYNTHDNTLIGVYKDAFILHQFFYGWTDRIEDIESAFMSTEKGIELYRSNPQTRYSSQRKKLAHG